jgi:hypothetical protein
VCVRVPLVRSTKYIDVRCAEISVELSRVYTHCAL